MSRRILDETTKSTFASDDYLYMDGATDGSSKITPDNLVRGTTVAQQLAQHIADAEDDVEQITSDIEDIQSDITDIKSDIGDLEDLETTDKSSIVNAINEARGSGGSGLTADIKTALLQIAQKVAYIDDDGQDYYDDLYDALYAITAIALNTNSLSFASLNSTQQLTATTTPAGGNVTWSSSNTSVATVSSTGLVTSVAYGSATITATAGSVSATCSVVVAQATCTGITATYTQSGTVYDSDTLDSLKTDLVVTASWSNGTTSTLADTDYTLSGTLTEGTSTITVAYGGQTDTFTVTVSHLSILPSGYQEVEYIKSTGTQYIDTGVSALDKAYDNANSIIHYSMDIDFQFDEWQNAKATNIIAGFGSSTGNWIGYNNDVGNIAMGTTEGTYFTDNNPTARHSYHYAYDSDGKTGRFVRDDNAYITRENTVGSSNTRNLWLFSAYGTFWSIAKIYSCVVYKDSVKVRELYPCYRTSDNEIGMYDIVNDVFYTNSGTGTFLKGSDV